MWAGAGMACPGRLYNELISPLVGFNLRAALWYQGSLRMRRKRRLTMLYILSLDNMKKIVLPRQARDKHSESTLIGTPFLIQSAGEANSDEGYHRDTEEYACEFGEETPCFCPSFH
jgi:hypothetical protein